MKFIPSTCFALSLALVSAGCGNPNISHGPGGTGGNGSGGTGGNGTGGNGGTGGTGGTGGGGGGGGSNNCGVQDFMLTKGGTPDLLLIQDRSGSMDMDASGQTPVPPATSKWVSMTAALKQVVASVTSVDWGLLLFPDPNAFDTCSVATKPDVAIAPNNAMNISTALTNAKPGGGTPTGTAVDQAVTYLQSVNNGHTHYLLVATDGEPSCFDSQATTVTAINNAVMNGIKVFVVGIANTGADATLTAMADAGGVPNMTAGQKHYYEASTTQDLVNVLNKVTGQLVSCTYALQKAPDNPDLVEIQGNGMTIPRDKTHMNGWDFGPGNLSINFYGMACDALQKGITTMITAVYGCPPIG